MTSAARADVATRGYLVAKERVIGAGFEDEIAWQSSVDPHAVANADFAREAAWVVLSSGMREAVVRRVFPSFSHQLLEFHDLKEVSTHRPYFRSRATKVFAHGGKVDAVLEICGEVDKHGATALVLEALDEGVGVLERLPYIGPATARHLAKNLGLSVAKPDRHLLRIAAALGYVADVDRLCRTISEACGDAVAVIDLVFWRFATIEPAYPRLLRVAQENNAV